MLHTSEMSGEISARRAAAGGEPPCTSASAAALPSAAWGISTVPLTTGVRSILRVIPC